MPAAIVLDPDAFALGRLPKVGRAGEHGSEHETEEWCEAREEVRVEGGKDLAGGPVSVGGLEESIGIGGRRNLGDLDRDMGETYVHRSSHCRGLNGTLAGGIPAIFFPRREDELGVRVCSYELGDERAGW